MAEAIKKVVLDVAKENEFVYCAKSGDALSRFLDIRLVNAGSPVAIGSGEAVTITVQRPDGVKVTGLGSVSAEGTAVVELTSNMLSVPGTATCEVTVIGQNGAILTSLSFLIEVEKVLRDDDAAAADDEFPIFTQAIADMAAKGQAAEEAAAHAESVVADSVKLKGSVRDYASLPSVSVEDGDAYKVEADAAVEEGLMYAGTNELIDAGCTVSSTGIDVEPYGNSFCTFLWNLFGSTDYDNNVLIGTVFGHMLINGDLYDFEATSLTYTDYGEGYSSHGVVMTVTPAPEEAIYLSSSDTFGIWLDDPSVSVNMTTWESYLAMRTTQYPGGTVFAYHDNSWVPLSPKSPAMDETPTYGSQKAVKSGGVYDALEQKAAVNHSHNASNITSGTLPVARGGTGKNSWETNKIVYASGSTSMAQIPFPQNFPSSGCGFVIQRHNNSPAVKAPPTGCGIVYQDGKNMPAFVNPPSVPSVLAQSVSGTPYWIAKSAFGTATVDLYYGTAEYAAFVDAGGLKDNVDVFYTADCPFDSGGYYYIITIDEGSSYEYFSIYRCVVTMPYPIDPEDPDAGMGTEVYLMKIS